jgi:hypothetical protein
VIRQVRSGAAAQTLVLALLQNFLQFRNQRFEVENLPDVLLELGAVGWLDIDVLKSATNKAASRTRALRNLHGRSWLIKAEKLF